MIKGIIFDLDGVIIHTDQFHYQAWKRLADSLGLHFDESTNNELRGVSRMASLEIILSHNHKSYSIDEKERLTNQKNDFYREFLSTLKSSDINSNVVDTLKRLKQNGYKLAIGSSSKNSKYILDKTQLIDYFDAIVDGTMITHSKPHPEVFLKAAEGLRLDVNDCMVVEDAISGIDAANSAGIQSCGIGPASQYHKADYKINQLSELLSLLQLPIH